MTVFCKISDLKMLGSVEAGYNGDDALLGYFIMQASAQIRTYTRRQWDRSEYTDYVSTTDIDRHIRRGKSTFVISLREKNVSVEEAFYPKLRYETAGKWDSTDDIDRSVYSVDTYKSQIILYPQILSSNARSVRIVYRAGYPTIPDVDNGNVLDVPDNIKAACVAQANWLFRKHLNDTNGTDRAKGQERVAAAGVTSGGLCAEALSLIKGEVKLLTGS